MTPQYMSAAATVLFALSSCAIQADLPDEFLVMTATAHEFKAITPTDAVFWVQEYDLPARGENLDFWVAALKKDFIDHRGYTLLESESIKTVAGESGLQMLFEANVAGRPYRYLVALFVRSGPIARVARYTAEKAEFEAQVDGVKSAILSLRG